jgi:hypothetical protein
VAGVLVTPIALLIGIISGGAGHGSYVAARLVLPFACLTMGAYSGASWVVSILAILEWPTYGALIDKASHKALTGGIILALHAAASIWLFSKSAPMFN